MALRIVTGGIAQETNTFQWEPTSLADFQKGSSRILRGEDLVTERAPILMSAADGTVIEVFEWVSKDAMSRAHTNPRVLELWGRYAQVCDYVPVSTVAEAGQLFSDFEPLPAAR